MINIAELEPESRAVIKEIHGDGRLRSRVSSMGLIPGSYIEVVQNRKKQPVLVYGRDTMIAIGREEAEKIEVEMVNATGDGVNRIETGGESV